MISKLCLFLCLNSFLGTYRAMGEEMFWFWGCWRIIHCLSKLLHICNVSLNQNFWFCVWWQDALPKKRSLACFLSVIRWLELVPEPSVLAKKSVASPPVSGSVIFGNHIIDGLVVLSPERGAVPSWSSMGARRKPSSCCAGKLQPGNYCCDSLDDFIGNRIIISCPHLYFTWEEGLEH